MSRQVTSSVGLVLAFCFVSTVAFLPPQNVLHDSGRISTTPLHVSTATKTTTTTTTLFIDKKWFASDDEDQDALVTREMLMRDMMEDPKVKRKKRKGGGYKPLDNRDHLPFAVKKITPDPYTHPQVKKANQKRVNSKKTDLDHMLSSRLYSKADDDKDSTLLGEFKLDKSTTSGDVIQIGDREYRVESARSQYKYAGGSRFVMVRKILEVKEVARALREDLLMKQFSGEGRSSNNATDVPNLE